MGRLKESVGRLVGCSGAGRHLTQVKQFMGIKKEKNNKKKRLEGLSACASDGVKFEIYSLKRSKAQAGISGRAAQIANGPGLACCCVQACLLSCQCGQQQQALLHGLQMEVKCSCCN